MHIHANSKITQNICNYKEEQLRSELTERPDIFLSRCRGFSEVGGTYIEPLLQFSADFGNCYYTTIKQEEMKVSPCVLWFTLLQIAQIDLLTKMGLKPDGIIGHSVGELACGYADGSLSHSEAILAAYWRGRCIKEANLPPGGMAAVGKTE